MTKKRFLQSISICFCMIFVTLSCQSPVYAQDNRELRINQLMEQRAEAICTENTDKITEIDMQLAELGVEDLSAEEVKELFADDESSARWLTPPDSTNVTWKSYQWKVVSDGKTYEAQTLLAQPKNASSNLSKTGATMIDSSCRFVAGASNVVKIVATASVPEFKGRDFVMTLYNSLKGYMQGINKETVINGAAIQYTYNTTETVSLIYVRKEGQSGNQSLKLSHRSSTCTTVVGCQYVRLGLENGSFNPEIEQNKFTLVTTPNGYNDPNVAVNAYKKSIATTAWAKNVTITGIKKENGNKDETIAVVSLITPEGPAHIM